MRKLTSFVKRAVRTIESRVVVATGVQAAAGILFALLTARWLGPQSRGAVVVFMTTASFLMLVGSWGISTGSRVLLNGSPPLGLTRYMRQARILSLIHLLTASTVGLLVLAKTGGMPTIWVGVIFVPFAAAQLYCYFQREALHGIGRHRSALYGEVLSFSLLTAGVIILHAGGKLNLVDVCLVVLIGYLAQVGFLTARLATYHQSAPVGHFTIRELMKFSMPALVTTLGQSFVIRGDRLVLGLLAGAAPVGIYGAAASFTEVLWLIPSGVAQVAFRRASLTRTSRAGAAGRRITLLITAAACLVLMVCTKPLVMILLGPAYAQAIPLAYILIPASLPMASYTLDVAVLNGLGRLSHSGHATTLGSVVLLVGCLAMIPTLGAFGAAWSSLVSYTAMAGLARWYLHRDKPSPLPGNGIVQESSL
jgi:O-antigen/teichoic acid export membrane protein